MDLFMNCVFFCFMLVAVIWGMIQIFHSHVHELAKGALLLLAAFLVFHFLPRSGFAHGPSLTFFGTLGIAIVAAYAIHHFHDWQRRTMIVVLAIGLVFVKAYPYFVSPASITSGIMPASPSVLPALPSASPTPSSPARSRSSRSPRSRSGDPPIPDLCSYEDLPYEHRKELGCP